MPRENLFQVCHHLPAVNLTRLLGQYNINIRCTSISSRSSATVVTCVEGAVSYRDQLLWKEQWPESSPSRRPLQHVHHVPAAYWSRSVSGSSQFNSTFNDPCNLLKWQCSLVPSLFSYCFHCLKLPSWFLGRMTVMLWRPNSRIINNLKE